MNDLDFTGMTRAECDAYMVGDLTAPLRNPDWREGVYADDGTNDFYRPNVVTADLMRLAEVGNTCSTKPSGSLTNRTTGSFSRRRSAYGSSLINAALIEMDLSERDGRTGEVMTR